MAVANIDTILLDHAHCEKKAASTALTLIFHYPEFNQFLRPLSAVAREELEHFELVLDHLQRREANPSNGWHRVHTLESYLKSCVRPSLTG